MTCPPPIDPYDLGLEDVKNYPECAACRKKSDGALPFFDRHLCGTHADEYLASSERRAALWAGRPRPNLRASRTSMIEAFNAFVLRLRTERYAACWEAKKE